MGQSRSPNVMVAVAGLACLSMLVLKALWPYIDPDLWWHLRVGQWIVEHGRLPQTDPFSQLGIETGKPWLAYSWLFELLVYGIYQTLGLAGIVLYRVVMAVAVFAAFCTLASGRKPRPLVWVVSVGLSSVTLFLVLTER